MHGEERQGLRFDSAPGGKLGGAREVAEVHDERPRGVRAAVLREHEDRRRDVGTGAQWPDGARGVGWWGGDYCQCSSIVMEDE